MAAIPVIIIGTITDGESTKQVTINGLMGRSDLSIGGGPIETPPPVVGGGPVLPTPKPPIPVQPLPEPPTTPPDPPTEVKPPPPGGGWGWHPEYGWGYFPGGKPQPMP